MSGDRLHYRIRRAAITLVLVCAAVAAGLALYWYAGVVLSR